MPVSGNDIGDQPCGIPYVYIAAFGFVQGQENLSFVSDIGAEVVYEVLHKDVGSDDCIPEP